MSKRRNPQDKARIVMEFFSTNITAAELYRKHNVLPGGGGCTALQAGLKAGLELRPAWRRATARRSLRVFSWCVPYCRIRPALAVPYFPAAGCPRRVCRNPPSIRGLFWTPPPT